ncbi:porphobilinogen deaminase [Nannizzia gypsea CBS 118893]|uniref:Porphobilinogen deaminase n=1 Tax=Arthroderma gypseum (strain ATCC MYA-4604 / CBS 118893) TaxID=535722 RepID=E4USC2_ARTGP|nr:porphobilinogen deaminase [Nannizzia gypsea CBS 118893]EFR01326.1 porphobilinogen deaminase [Nannizzia gypsea CBS 118893]
MAETEASVASLPLRIGTRRSNLAVIQAKTIRSQLEKIAPEHTFEIEALHTLGDKDQNSALYNFGAKDLWTTELEELLTSGKLDIVVHCLKDMPTQLPDSCDLAAIPLRDDPRDALVIKAGLPYTSLQTLPEGAIVGTSSVRRSAQLRRLFPHLRFMNIRGNVETRLAKLDDPKSEYICIVMSACGLELGQGAIGLEVRKGDAKILRLTDQLLDHKSSLACLAERSLMRTLEGGCSVPIGVETEWIDKPDATLRIRAIVVSIDGTQSVEDTTDTVVHTKEEATALGQELAARLLEAGAAAILKDINTNRPPKD